MWVLCICSAAQLAQQLCTDPAHCCLQSDDSRHTIPALLATTDAHTCLASGEVAYATHALLSTLQYRLRQPWSLSVTCLLPCPPSYILTAMSATFLLHVRPVTCLLPCPHLGYTGTTQAQPSCCTAPVTQPQPQSHAHAHQKTFIQGCRTAMDTFFGCSQGMCHNPLPHITHTSITLNPALLYLSKPCAVVCEPA